MDEQKAIPLSGEKISHVLTRIALALVYLSFGYVQLVSPVGWVSYLPGILQRLPIDPQFFIFLNGSVEIILGLFLLLGAYIRPVAFILGVHLFGIAATIGFNAVGIRDFGLSLATLGVALAGNDSFSLEAFARRRSAVVRWPVILVFHACLALLAGAAFAFSVATYDGPFLAVRTSDGTAAGTAGDADGSGITLDVASIAAHDSADDCWLIINDRVYSVAEYVPFHPGGEKRITDLCGTEATAAFATKGGTGSDHSGNAKSLLEKYFVGTVGTVVSDRAAAAAAAGDAALSIPTQTPTATVTPTPAPVSQLTAASVAAHNKASDCWIIVSGNVYDVTAYIPYHPGGTNRITNVCGQEATTAFTTRGGTGSHSSYAKSLLSQYFIGALGATITPTPTLSVTPAPTATPTATVTPTPAPTALTPENVATHNTSSSCWLIINSKVYDVTAYIPLHPGGTNRIIVMCGKESTSAFETRGGGGSHSTYAHNLLAAYLLGPLAAGGVTPTPGATVTPSPTDPQQPYRDAILAQYPGAVITQLSIEDDGRAEFKFTYGGRAYEGKMNAQHQITSIE